jgi:hypothetical protein
MRFFSMKWAERSSTSLGTMNGAFRRGKIPSGQYNAFLSSISGGRAGSKRAEGKGLFSRILNALVWLVMPRLKPFCKVEPYERVIYLVPFVSGTLLAVTSLHLTRNPSGTAYPDSRKASTALLGPDLLIDFARISYPQRHRL